MLENNIDFEAIERQLQNGGRVAHTVSRCTALELERLGALQQAYSNLVVVFADNLFSEGYKDNFERGIVQLKRQQSERALDSFRRALEYLPEEVRALTNCGATLAGMGREQEAIPLLRKAVEVSDESEVAIASLQLGMALARVKQEDEARVHLRHALNRSARGTPENEMARKYLRWIDTDEDSHVRCEERRWWQFWK